MSEPAMPTAGGLRLRLPATSANLGPGFDAVAVALNFYLELEAEPAAEFSIAATGRNADRCGRTENNLILETYKGILVAKDRPIISLAIKMHNEIPLAMGCGSSAAGRLAAIVLAVHFGQLGWSSERILYEAYRLEGHPDNVAACWLGGFVVAACDGEAVRAAQVVPPPDWRAIVVLPAESLATSKARAVLPATYPVNDVVANIQSVAMLGLAFAQGRGDLLRTAMSDRIHQPYRASICPLLPLLLPLVGEEGILGAALSGAGPAVLVIVETEECVEKASVSIRKALGNHHAAELLVCRFEGSGVTNSVEFSPLCKSTSILK
jgi:homoserine kinase